MLKNVTSAAIACACSTLLATGVAGAQEQGDDSNRVQLGEGQTGLPPAQTTPEERPPVAAPSVVAPEGVVEQAGVGSDVAYGRAGVLELGGFASLASARDYFSLGFSPTIGYFIIDNVQLSAIVGVNYVSQTVPATNLVPSQDVTATSVLLLAEPSFHLPFDRALFGFIGVGVGLASQSNSPGPDPGTGFALAPRLGANIMIGRSGILTPSLQWVFQTTESVSTPQGTLLAVDSVTSLNVGYTVMW